MRLVDNRYVSSKIFNAVMTLIHMQGLHWLRICCSQHFSQMEKVDAKSN